LIKGELKVMHRVCQQPEGLSVLAAAATWSSYGKSQPNVTIWLYEHLAYLLAH